MVHTGDRSRGFLEAGMDVEKMSELRNEAVMEPMLEQYLQKRETQGSQGL